MSTILISEVGNCHNGCIKTAKEMIRVSRECGADLVKMQAFNPNDINGSMERGFYEKCALNIFQYTELIEYGKDIGIEVFYSIFSKEFKSLEGAQKYKKIAASQSQKNIRATERADAHNVFISLRPNDGMLPDLKVANVLYASKYLVENPYFENLTFLNQYYGRNCGYSDHTIGIEYCIEAIQEYECPVIEKHFTLTRDIYFNGQQFRDAIHSALPYELERLAKHKRREEPNGKD